METKSNSFKNIVLFGASGRTGKAILAQANNLGINVCCVTERNPPEMKMRAKIRGMDAAIIVFGPRPPYKDIFCAEATERIIAAMKKEGVKRLICQTGAMIGDYSKNRNIFYRIMSRIFRMTNPEGYKDRVLQEKNIVESDLCWTIIKPPKLTDSLKMMKVYSGEDLKVGLMSKISRRSLATFVIDKLDSKDSFGRILFVKN